jgi:hypothetical protein
MSISEKCNTYILVDLETLHLLGPFAMQQWYSLLGSTFICYGYNDSLLILSVRPSILEP